MAHVLSVTSGGATQEFTVAADLDEGLNLVRTLFANAMQGEVIEIPVHVPGGEGTGRLIVNPANIATLLVWEKAEPHLRPERAAVGRHS